MDVVAVVFLVVVMLLLAAMVVRFSIEATYDLIAVVRHRRRARKRQRWSH